MVELIRRIIARLQMLLLKGLPKETSAAEAVACLDKADLHSEAERDRLLQTQIDRSRPSIEFERRNVSARLGELSAICCGGKRTQLPATPIHPVRLTCASSFRSAPYSATEVCAGARFARRGTHCEQEGAPVPRCGWKLDRSRPWRLTTGATTAANANRGFAPRRPILVTEPCS